MHHIIIHHISHSLTTSLFRLGNIPGNHIQTGHVFIFGSGANATAFLHEQNIFVVDFTLTCISNHIVFMYLVIFFYYILK